MSTFESGVEMVSIPGVAEPINLTALLETDAEYQEVNKNCADWSAFTVK